MGKQKHLRRMKDTYFVRLGIPADVRHAFGGKTEFTASTGKKNETEANATAGPILVKWKRQIHSVRAAVQKPAMDEWGQLAADYRRYRGTALDEAGAALVMDVVGFVMREVANLDPVAIRQALQDSSNISDVFQNLTNPRKVQDAFDQITGRATPFLTHIEGYKKIATVNDKSLSQAVSGIRKFAAAVDQPMETLTGGHVQAWLYNLKSEKKKNGVYPPADTHTKQRKLSELRGYWNHLVAMGYVPESPNPFEKRITANRETESEAQERKRATYKPSEVPKFWRQAMIEGDKPLAHLIRLSAYSGARLSELMNLTPQSVISDDGILCIHIKGGKTKSSRRTFPVHPDILDLIKELVADAEARSFLIKIDAKNRSDAMSKRFGRMKTAMGFDEAYVLHSIRHTVIQMFREENCPLEVRNLIVGHEDGDEKANAGAGYGDLSAKGRLNWMIKAIKYPT